MAKDPYLYPVTRAKEKLRRRAIDACNAAEFASTDERRFRINDLDESRRIAASALLYAALAHVLGSPGKQPKTLVWLGRRWYLVPRESGRLEVRAYRDNPGIVSMPGALP